MSKTMQRWLGGAGLMVALSGLAACGDSGSSGDDASQSSTSDVVAASSAAPEALEAVALAEPDIAGIPAVVATVNEEEISDKDFITAYEGQFQQYAAESQAAGQEVDQDQLKQQTVESMVSNILLAQAADAAKISPSAKEIDDNLEELAAGNGLGSAEELLDMLEEQGMGEQDVRTAVQDQLKVDQLIAQEASITEPTDEELRELYDSLAQQQTGGGTESGGESGGESALPPFEEVKPQLADQVKQQQESEAAATLIEELRAKAEVEINL